MASRGKAVMSDMLVYTQSNFNGSNTFGTMKISSRRVVRAIEAILMSTHNVPFSI